jgi:hypothetical protein
VHPRDFWEADAWDDGVSDSRIAGFIRDTSAAIGNNAFCCFKLWTPPELDITGKR